MKISNLKSQILLLCAIAALHTAPTSSAAAATLAPSGGDDTAAIQAALNAGGAVTLSGTLKISKTLTPANGASITGGQLAWIGPANTGNTYALKFAGAGLTVTGVTFNGAGLNLDGSTGATITKSTIENIPGGTPAGVYFGGLTNATIDSNSFSNIAAVGAIIGYDAQNCHFDGNTIANCYEGMHIIWNNLSGNCSVSFNNVSGFTRHGIELQGNPQGLAVDNNYVHDPAAATSHLWLSIATGGDTAHNTIATGVVIKGNVATAPAGFLANPQINYCMLEAMGIGTQVTGNYFAGGGWGGLYCDDAPAHGYAIAGTASIAQAGANPNPATAMSWTGNQYHAVGAGVPCTGEGSSSDLASVAPIGTANNVQDNAWTGTVPAAILATVGPAAMPGLPPGTGAATPALTPTTIPASQPATQPAATTTHTIQTNTAGKISIDGGPWQ